MDLPPVDRLALFGDNFWRSIDVGSAYVANHYPWHGKIKRVLINWTGIYLICECIHDDVVWNDAKRVNILHQNIRRYFVELDILQKVTCR